MRLRRRPSPPAFGPFPLTLGRRPRRVIAGICLALAFASATGARAQGHHPRPAGVVAGAGRVAIPVVLGILPAADFLHVGDRVDLLAAPDDGDAAGLDTRARSPATVVAEDLLVLSIPHDSTMSSSDQTSVVVAATRDEALRITGTNVHAFVAVVRNGPSIAP